MIGSTTISPSMIGLGLFIFFPLMISLMSGASFGKLDCWGKTQMPSFFATRPIATTNFVTVKIVAAVIVSLLCWAIVLGLFAIWAGLEASPFNQHESLIRNLLSQATPRSIAAVLFGVFALVFFTWRNLAAGMWLVLCGRKWVANLIGFGSLGVMCVGGLAGWWILRHPEIQPRMLVFAPWLCGCALAIKFGITAAVVVAMVHRNLVQPTHGNHSPRARLVCNGFGSFRRRLLLLPTQLDGSGGRALCLAARCDCLGAVGPALEPSSVVKVGASVMRHRQLQSTVSGRWSVVSGRWSVASGRWSVASGR